MRRWGIRKKILVVSLAPTLLTTIVLGLFFTYSWISDIERLLHDRGHSLSRQLSSAAEFGLLTGDRRLLKNLSNALLEEPDVHSVTFYGARQQRLLHSGAPAAAKLSAQVFDQVEASHWHLPGSTQFVVPVFAQDLLLDTAGGQGTSAGAQEPLGWVAMEMSHLRTEKETYKALLISLLLVVTGVLISLLLVMRLSRAFINPVLELNKAIALLKEGQLATRVYTRAGPEFEQLESGLNAMAEKLSKARAEMQQNVEQATEDLRETLETIEIQNIELDLARKEALEASRIKSEFLANMSHEIRTPLNGIIGFTELLLRSPLPRQQRDHLNTIRKSSEILLTIINDILDFSKIEAGKLILDRVPYQLRDIIEEVMSMLAPAAHHKNLDLVPLVYNDVPDNVLGDPLRVKQVITNLVNNAIKFTQTGEVVLRASLDSDGDADGQPDAVDSHRVTLRISITDSGVGLSRAQQQSLFNAFSQADASTARQYGGTGLGLAISKRLVEEMGGTIGLESELGKGSTFWFTLTCDLSAKRDAPPSRDALQGERVIYLELQRTTGLAVEHLLNNWGLVVDSVKSPEELLERVALAQQQQAGYALALIGLTRHLVNSSQYAKLVRTLELEHDCRTLTLTPTPDSHDSPLTDLASGHIIKPVCRDAFYDELLFLIRGVGYNAYPAPGPSRWERPETDPTPRVLAVDDNDANLKLILTLLDDNRIRTEGATSGFEALSKARSKPFDLIFMDLQMPGMDGVETTARLRQLDDHTHRTPIIALTAHALADEQDLLRQQGFDGYMAKPIDSRQLMSIIREHTGYTAPRLPEPDAPEIFTVRDTRGEVRPSARQLQPGCVDLDESVRLAAGKTDLAEELLSMLLEQLATDREQIASDWQHGRLDALLERVHKLHGGTRYCGVPELRAAAEQLESGLKRSAPDLGTLIDTLLAAMERVQRWSEQTDWQSRLRAHSTDNQTN
ncbi:ATP-binding protein [Marinobacter sp. X15-166B]|uniref:ATP-binding protein n=1 Tax=Marinobacter sp. X15-166B TaxID=1897620 RepID=UPI00085C6EA3|nr:ATP-binding protein [Marinobacter sp. X15-166B]OEY66911.1 hybrid sensor histidine kinase/response regulator [Marinobacter sp. X15-166B]